jgi:hypothetical protein
MGNYIQQIIKVPAKFSVDKQMDRSRLH